MSKLRKTAHKVVKKTAQVLDPIQYNLYGKKALDKTADWTSENVWSDPVAPEADSTVAASPMVMPESDDEQLAKARRKRIAAQRARSGRTSTVLTDTDGLGG
jgi:hypothetical protein